MTMALSPTTWRGPSAWLYAYRKPSRRPLYSAILLVVALFPYAMLAAQTTEAAW
jgi:hypothetical protein